MRYTGVVNRVRIPAVQGLQQVGSIIFYPGGAARLGEHVAHRGAPLDGLVFSIGFEAYRRLDAPEFLHVKEPGNPPTWRKFEYRWTEELWFEHVKSHDPMFLRRVNRYGPLLGKLVHGLSNMGMDVARVVMPVAALAVLSFIATAIALVWSLLTE